MAGHGVSDDLQDREGPMRLSQRLVSLHVAGTVILVLVVLASVLWVSDQHNRLALRASERLVEGGVSSFRTRIRTLVTDYSIWDEAYQAAVSGDRTWLYSNIGNAAAEIGTLDLIYFLNPQGGESYGWRAGSPTAGERGLIPSSLLAAILKQLGDASAGDGSGTLMAIFQGEPWVFSAALVRPVAGFPEAVPRGLLPVQIHGMRLSDERLQEIGRNLLVDDLALSRKRPPGRASLPLVDYSGRTIGFVGWDAPRPGAAILSAVALPIGLALLLVAVVSAISSRYAVRSASSLERALLAAKEADRSKSEFLSNVSHELRTPMNGILGVAQLLQTTPLDDEQRELVQVLFASANAQMALISDLLDFGRLESGNRLPALEPFEPIAVLRDVAEMVRVAADRKAITLDCRWQQLDGAAVVGDARAFRQVVTNLLGNAVKFTDQGCVTLRVSATREAGRIDLAISVEDTGRGIPADALPLVFERFYRVDGSLSRDTEGTGLGLAISQNLARMMGGRIEVASRMGIGSIFTFTVGLDLADTGCEALDAA